MRIEFKIHTEVIALSGNIFHTVTAPHCQVSVYAPLLPREKLSSSKYIGLQNYWV